MAQGDNVTSGHYAVCNRDARKGTHEWKAEGWTARQVLDTAKHRADPATAVRVI